MIFHSLHSTFLLHQLFSTFDKPLPNPLKDSVFSTWLLLPAVHHLPWWSLSPLYLRIGIVSCIGTSLYFYVTRENSFRSLLTFPSSSLKGQRSNLTIIFSNPCRVDIKRHVSPFIFNHDILFPALGFPEIMANISIDLPVIANENQMGIFNVPYSCLVPLLPVTAAMPR